MKISMEANRAQITQEIENYVTETSWKYVALAVARGRSDFQESAATARDLHNIEQQIKRAIRGNTDYYRRQFELLAPELVAILPVERRARLADPDNPMLLATVAAREGIQAVNAVHLRAPADVIESKINLAIAAFAAMKMAVVNTMTAI